MGILEKVLEAYVAGSISLVNAFNPKRLVFGGGLINGMPEVVEVVEYGVKERALKAATKELEVIEATLGNQAGVIGSATFAMQGVIDGN
jgi:glucokinase